MKKRKKKSTVKGYANGGEIASVLSGVLGTAGMAIPGLAPIGAAASVIPSLVQLFSKPELQTVPGGPSSNVLGFAYGGDLKNIAPNTIEVQGNNPNQVDGVRVGNIALSDEETITDNYVFSNYIINPLTGNTLAKDNKRIALSDKKASKKPLYDREAQRTLKLNKLLRDKLITISEGIRNRMYNNIMGNTGVRRFQHGGPLHGDPTKPPVVPTAYDPNNPYMDDTQTPLTYYYNDLPTNNTGQVGSRTFRMNQQGDPSVYAPEAVPKVYDAEDPYVDNTQSPLTYYYNDLPTSNTNPTPSVGNNGNPGVYAPEAVPKTYDPNNPYVDNTQTPLTYYYNDLPLSNAVPGTTPYVTVDFKRNDPFTFVDDGSSVPNYLYNNVDNTSTTSNTTNTIPNTTPKTASRTASRTATKTTPSTTSKATPKTTSGTTPKTTTKTTPSTASETTTETTPNGKTGTEQSASTDPIAEIAKNNPNMTFGQLKDLLNVLSKSSGENNELLPPPKLKPVVRGQTGIKQTDERNVQGNFKDNLGSMLQYAELVGKAAMVASGPERQKLYTINTPIGLRAFDPKPIIQQNALAYNTLKNNLRNTVGLAAKQSNLQQAASNYYRSTSDILSKYQNINKQEQTRYEQRLAQRQALNNRARLQTDIINAQNRAAMFNAVNSLFTSVGNLGRAKEEQKQNKLAISAIAQAFPDVAPFMNFITNLRNLG